jgi:hypothetical protein
LTLEERKLKCSSEILTAKIKAYVLLVER